MERKNSKFPKEDYDKVLEKYQEFRLVTLQGPEFLPLQQAIKTMFMSNRSVQDIIGAMWWLASGKESWMENWTISTVKMKMPNYIAYREKALNKRLAMDEEEHVPKKPRTPQQKMPEEMTKRWGKK